MGRFGVDVIRHLPMLLSVADVICEDWDQGVFGQLGGEDTAFGLFPRDKCCRNLRSGTSRDSQCKGLTDHAALSLCIVVTLGIEVETSDACVLNARTLHYRHPQPKLLQITTR